MSTANQPLPPLNYSKTQRIVLLIDLQPLLTSFTSADYISTVISAASRLLHFPPLSASLFSYKFFFSSQTAFRTSAILPRHLSTLSLSFDLPLRTLKLLSSTLQSISLNTDSISYACSLPASNTASSLLQLIHDYAWETIAENSSGKDDLCLHDLDSKIPSHLVILFSRVVGCIDGLDMFKFDDVFSDVREAFLSRDIHLCWIDIVEREGLKIEKLNGSNSINEFGLADSLSRIKKMGWGFCSSDWIILGSSLLPLGLIYPRIGVSFDFVYFSCLDMRRCHGSLSLEILGVNRMPVECNFCDLEFVSLKDPNCMKSDGVLEFEDWKIENYIQDAIMSRFGNGSIKIYVKKVHRYDEYANDSGGTSEIFLVRECFLRSEMKTMITGGNFFADQVLEMLHKEMGGVADGNQLPIWQIFLSFLYLKGYWASVSISSNNGDSFMGSLRPFTSHLAILSVFSAGSFTIKVTRELKLPKIECEPDIDRRRKKNNIHLLQEMTWSLFREAAFGGSNFDLFEVYSVKQFKKTKKLMFLKFWMKQIPNHDPHDVLTHHGSKPTEELAACNIKSEPSQVEDACMPVFNAETSETFFSILSKTIQHGLESGTNLHNLAEKVVKSSIHWLHQKCETENYSEGKQPRRNLHDSVIVGKLIKLLLRKPKEMNNIKQEDPSSSKESNPCSSEKNIVREYEMQILLRMEILQSDVSGMIDESEKQKLMKQICSLLEIIQYLIGGGLHGNISLYEYVEKTIKARYSDRLEDVVEMIYSELELDLPLDEDETPSHLFNSEDSNQSWRDIWDKYNKTENNTNISVSTTDGDSTQPLGNANKGSQDIGNNDRVLIINEGHEKFRSERSKFVSFTRRAPDSQRVWGPKQPKVTKGKFDSLAKQSKGKNKRRPIDSVVCETPMTGNKHASSRENNNGDREQHDLGNSSYSVAKALFQNI